jgi:diguanylate cyclase (GGDEF)-like protein
MNVQAVLELQATLLFFLGTVVLLAHHTSRSPDAHAGARWFFGASVCGAAGLALQSQHGHWPAILTIVAGNFLFLLLPILLTHSIALTIQASSRVVRYLLAIAVATVSMLSYYTFWVPDTTRRVLIAMTALSILFMPAAVLLLRSKQRSIQAATQTLAGLILAFIVSCLIGVVPILRGAHPLSGVNWIGAVLIAGVALCFLWMDLLCLRAALEQQAITDPLTGLLNRRAIELFSEREVARAVRNGSAITLLMLDVDRFKLINDYYGHLAGDAALRAIADVLKATVRGEDLAIRTGGDEFAVLLTESSEEIAAKICKRISEGVQRLALKNRDGKPFPVSVTIGSYTTPRGERKTYADLVHASDVDLYLKKQKMRMAGLPEQGEHGALISEQAPSVAMKTTRIQ